MSTSNLGRAFLVVAVCSAIAACGGQTLDSRQLDFNNGLVYQHGSTTPFTGTVLFKDSIPEQLVEYWSNNVAANGDNSAQNALAGCKVHYSNGVIGGPAECQGVGGKTALTVGFTNEKYDGVSKIYNPQTGSLFKVVPWKAGVVDGEEKTFWFDTGTPHWDGHLSGGVLDGSVKEWDHDGKVITDATYSSGSPVSGLITDNKGSVHYKDGKLDGPAVLIGQDGRTISSKGNFSNGKRDGIWQDAVLSTFGVNNKIIDTLGAAFGSRGRNAFLFLSPDTNLVVTSNWSDGILQGDVYGVAGGKRVFALHEDHGELDGPFTFRASLNSDGRGTIALDATQPQWTIDFKEGAPLGCIGGKLAATRAQGEVDVVEGTLAQWLTDCAARGSSANAASVTQSTQIVAAEAASESREAPAGSSAETSSAMAEASMSSQGGTNNDGASALASPPAAAPREAGPAADVAQTNSDGIHASFDCAKAGSPVEKMICSNQMLADYDVHLMSSYKAALAASRDKAAVKDAQRAWMAQRNACTTLDCVSRAYQVRIKQLDATR